MRTLTVGSGPPLVLLHGFAMRPETYLPLAELLAAQVQVVIPAIFELPGAWRYDRALASLAMTLDDLDLGPASLLGHSFGGGLELGYAAARPDVVVECVFADTLGVADRFHLAGEALRHPLGLRHMATPPAIDAFARSAAHQGRQLVDAAWWGFISDRNADIERVTAAGIPCHVLWASRDSLLPRTDGEEFARRLHASFDVAAAPEVDHDWMFDDPELFMAHLESLHLRALDATRAYRAQHGTTTGKGGGGHRGGQRDR